VLNHSRFPSRLLFGDFKGTGKLFAVNHQPQRITMADEITITKKSDSESNPAAANGHQTVSITRTLLVNLCAAGLGGSFFLPWVIILGAPVSGFDLQKLGDEQRLLWAIPILCTITIAAGLAKGSQKVVGQLTGILPFGVGVYWFYKIGPDLFNGLTYGAYLSLICGAALFVLPRKSK
jgi:hypothetical protein